MKKAKKVVSLALSLGIAAGSLMMGSVNAHAAAFHCDTTTNFNLNQGSTYQFAVTSSAKPNFGIGNSKIFQLVGSSKSGQNYYFKIKAIGKPNDCAGIYVNGTRQCVISVADPNDPSKSKVGSYGIVELSKYDANKILTEVGVLGPIRRAYDPSRTFEEHAKAINYNLYNCDLVNNAIIKESDSSHAYIRFIQKDGKFGLKITGWRSKKSDNTQAATLNGALTAMVYLADSKKAGEAIWAWVDAFKINGGHVNTTDYGFKDSETSGDIVYKDGTKMNINFSGGITILFKPE